MNTKSLIALAPMPTTLTVPTVQLKGLAMAAYAELYNSDEAFREKVSTDGVTVPFAVNREVDNWIAAEYFFAYCEKRPGVLGTLASLDAKAKDSLFRALRKDTKTSPSARLALARKEAKAAAAA